MSHPFVQFNRVPGVKRHRQGFRETLGQRFRRLFSRRIAAAQRLNYQLEPLEPRLLLSADPLGSAAQILHQGLDQVDDWARQLETLNLSSEALAELNPSLGQLADIDGTLARRLIEPLSGYLESRAEQATTDGALLVLGQTLDEIRDLSTVDNWQLGITLSDDQQRQQGDVALSTQVSMALNIGVDRTAAGADDGGFYLQVKDMTVQVAGSDEAITTAAQGFTLQFNDPDADGRLTLSELQDTPLPELVTVVATDGTGVAQETVSASGDIETTLVQATIDAEPVLDEWIVEQAGAAHDSEQAGLQLVFVDPAVQDYERLYASIIADDHYGDTSGTGNMQVVVLDAERDGIEQITEALAGYTNVAGIHILSHGSNGSLQLGSTSLTNANLDDYQQQLGSWHTALDGEADILLYGCNVASGEWGVDFTRDLSALTGADVAASDDLTGNAALGGDWELEYTVGNIETLPLLRAATTADYQYVLATVTTGLADAGSASFTGSAGSDSLWLRLNDSGVLEYSEDGETFLSDLDAVTALDQELLLSADSLITVDLGDADDTLYIDTLLREALSSFEAMLTFLGGAGDGDSLMGPALDSIWDINAGNAGTLNTWIGFSGVENLTGAAGNEDTFVLKPGGSLSGVLDGGDGGFDSLVIEGDSYDTVAFSATGPQSGSVNLDGNAITYAGLEPIDLLFLNPFGSVANVIVDANPLLGDDLVLENHTGTGTMQVRSLNGTMESVSFANPTESLTINLGDGVYGLLGTGDDILSLTSFDSGFDAALIINGGDGADQVFVSQDIILPGSDINIKADSASLTVNDGVTLSTRTIGISTDYANAASTGDSGNIDLVAEIITVGSGAMLLAHDDRSTNQTTSAGDITLLAKKTGIKELEDLGPLNFQEKVATIDIGAGAQISGTNLIIRAEAADKSFAAQLGTSELFNEFLIDPLINGVSGLLDMPFKVLFKESDARVTVNENVMLTGTAGVTLEADSIADASQGGGADTATASRFPVKAGGELFAIGYVEATSTAIVDIKSGVIIDAGDAVAINADSTAVALLETKSGVNLDEYPDDPTKQSLSLAITRTDLTSQTLVADGVTITAGKTVNITAEGLEDSEAEAKSGLYTDGRAGLAFGLSFADANINAVVNGTVIAHMDAGSVVKLEFDPTETDPNKPGFVDTTANTIKVGEHALATGDKIEYSNRRGTSIGPVVGGLTDGDVFFVITTEDATKIQLAETRDKAIAGNEISLASGAGVNSKNFTASSAVDSNKNTITLDNPALTGSGTDFSLLGSTFELGQAVRYDANGATPIEGLVDGKTYYVITGTNQYNLQGDLRFVDKQVIQLAETENEARAGVAINLDAAGGGGEHTLTALHVLDSGLATGIGVLASLDSTNKGIAGSGIVDEAQQTEVVVFNFQPDSLFSKLTEAYGSNADKPGIGASPGLQLAGALGFVQANHTVTADIGANAVLKSNEDLEVKAGISDALQINAESSVETVEGEEAADATISAAVIVGLVDNTAQATVASGAVLDALRATRVISDVSYPYLTRPDEFIPANLGELSDLLKSDGLDAVNDYADGTLGLKSKLFNTWARSSGSAGGAAFAGSVNFLDIDNISEAIVRSGAQINQDLDWRDNTLNPHANNTDQQVVSVEATNYLQMLNVTGVFDFQFPSGTLDPLDVRYDPKLDVSPVATEGGKGGVGGAIFISLLDNTTTALVESDVALYSGSSGSFNMKAEEAIMNLNFSQAGAEAGQYAIAGTVAYVEQDSHTRAQLASGVIITGGIDPNETDVAGSPVTIYAGSLETGINWAGSIAKGENLGFGITVAINDIDRDTSAIIGAIDPVVGTAPGRTSDINASGALNVNARVTGNLWAFSLAAAVRAEDAPDGDAKDTATDTAGATAATDSKGAGSNDKGNQGEYGLGISGDVSLNRINDNTRAYINDAGTFQADQIALSASNDTEILAVAGAVFVSSEAKSIGLAGSWSEISLTGATEAWINAATLLQVNGLSISANRTGDIFSITAGGSGAPAKGSITVAGSVSINRIANTTTASLDAVSGVVNGDVALTATDHSDLFAIAGAVSFGGKAGVGAAVGINKISNTTTASISGSTFTQTGELILAAASDATIEAITASAGVSQENLGAAGTVSINEISNTVAVSIIASQRPVGAPLTSGAISLSARDETTIRAIAGAVGVAKNVGFGAAVAYNAVENTVSAYLDDSVLTTTGSLSLAADSASLIETISAGVGGGKDVGLTGSVALNSIANTVDANIGNGSVIRASDVSVSTSDGTGDVTLEDTKIRSLAGALALGGRASLGAAVAINDIASTYSAHIDDADVKATPGSVELSSLSGGTIESLTFGVAGAGNFALGGSVSINEITNTIDAHVAAGARVEAGTGIALIATDTSAIDSIAGGIGLSGSVAVAAAVSTNEVGNIVNASAGSASDTAPTVLIANAGDIGLTASSVATIRSLSAGGGVAGSVGLAGSVAINVIEDKTSAVITGAMVTAGGNVGLLAESDASITAWGGTLAAGSSAGLGATVVLNTLDSQTRAEIDRAAVSAMANGGDAGVKRWDFDTGAEELALEKGLSVVSSSTSTLDVIAVTAGLGSGFSVSGNVTINSIGDLSEALITGSTINTADDFGGQVSVRAHQDTDVDVIGGALSVGGGAGIGAAVDRTFVSTTTRAVVSDFEDAGTSIPSTIYAQDFEASALSRTRVDPIIIGAAASGSLAVGGSVSVVQVKNTTEASVQNSDVFSLGGILIYADDNVAIDTVLGALAASGAASLGASVAVNNIEDSTQASALGARLNASGATAVQTDSHQSIDTILATGGLSGTVGIAGSVSVNTIESSTEAILASSLLRPTSINQDAAFQPGGVHAPGSTQTVLVQADDTASVSGLGGALGLGISLAGVGATIDVGAIRNRSVAIVGEQSRVHGEGDVSILANARHELESTTAAFGGGTIGLAGAISVLSLGAPVDADGASKFTGELTGNTNDDLALKNDELALVGSSSSAMKARANVGGLESPTVNDELDTVAPPVDNAAMNPLSDSSVRATAAFVENAVDANDRAEIVTGGALTIVADHTYDVDIVAGQIAVGLAGIGGSFGIASIGNTTKALVGDYSLLDAEGDVTITASDRQLDPTTNTSKIDVVGGQVGVIAAGGGLAKLELDRDASASLGDNAIISKAADVWITTDVVSNLEVDAVGLAIGAVAAGGMFADVEIGKSVATSTANIGNGAQIGSDSSPVQNVTVRATSDDAAAATAKASAGGVGAGAGSQADAGITATTNAYVGEDANVDADHDVRVEASGSVSSRATATGIAGGALSVGLSKAVAISNATVEASIGAAANVDAGGGIFVDADLLPKTDSHLAFAQATSSSGSLLAGFAGAESLARATGTVTAGVGDNAELTTTSGDIDVTADAVNSVYASTIGDSVGFITGGRTDADGYVITTSSATIGKGAVLTAADNMRIASTADSRADVESRGGTGAVIGGGTSDVLVDMTSNALTTISDNATLSATNNITLAADNRFFVRADAYMVADGVLANVTKANTVVQLSGNASVVLGENVTVTADSVDINVINRFDVNGYSESFTDVVLAGAFSKAATDVDVTAVKATISVGAGTVITGNSSLSMTAFNIEEGERPESEGGNMESRAKSGADTGVLATATADANGTVDTDAVITTAALSVLTTNSLTMQADSLVSLNRAPDAVAEGFITKTTRVVKEVVRKVTKWLPWPLNKIVEWVVDTVVSFVTVFEFATANAKTEGSNDSPDDVIKLDGDIYLGSEASKTLIVNADGTINPLSNVGATIDGNNVLVDDIINESSGSAFFRADNGIVSGMATIHVPKVLDSVRVENYSDRDLLIQKIALVSDNQGDPDVSIIDKDAQVGVDDTPFDIINAGEEGSRISIINHSTDPDADIIFTEKLDDLNVVAIHYIQADGGDILQQDVGDAMRVGDVGGMINAVATPLAFGSTGDALLDAYNTTFANRLNAVIGETVTLFLFAENGQIGSSAQPFTVEMLRGKDFPDGTLETTPVALKAVAYGDIFLTVSAENSRFTNVDPGLNADLVQVDLTSTHGNINLTGTAGLLLTPVTNTVKEAVALTGTPTLSFSDGVNTLSGNPLLTFADSILSAQGNPVLTFDSTVAMTGTSSLTFSGLITQSGTPNLDFLENGNIIRDDGGNWFADGFLPGQTITVTGSAANDGTYEIVTVVSSTLTLTSAATLTAESSVAGVTVATPRANARITRDSGSWIEEGFQAGQEITVSDAGANNGTYTIESVSGDVLVLIAGDTVSEASGVAGAAVGAERLQAIIARDTGSWLDDGFRAGQTITVTNAGVNDGTYTLAVVDALVLTLQVGSNVTDATDVSGSTITADRDLHTITRAAGSWFDDGFGFGQTIIISGTSTNNGTFTIASLTSDTITLADGESVADEITAGVILVSPQDDMTIGRDDGSWITDGFAVGQTVTISGTGANDGQYLINDISHSLLTLAPGAALSDETIDLAVTMVTITADAEQVVSEGVTLQATTTDAVYDILRATASLGNVTIDVTGDLNVGDVSAAGVAKLTASLDIIDRDNDSATDVAAANIDLTAAGDIGSTVNPFDINLSNTSNAALTASASGDVTIVETAGNLVLDSVSSTAGVVRLTAMSGSIVDDDTDSTTDIVAGGAILIASESLGSEDNPLETMLANLEGSAGNGGIWIDNTGALTIGGISDTVGLTAAGPIMITTFSPLTVTEDITSGGNITLTATDSTADNDDVVIADGADITSSGGEVTILAGDNVRIDAGTVITATGLVTILADQSDADAGGGVVEINGIILASAAVILGGDEDDIITIDNIVTPTTVLAGGGNDTIYIGSNATSSSNTGGNVNAIGALLVIDGGTGTDVLDVDDSADTAGNTGNLTGTMLTGLGMSSGIQYEDIESLTVKLGSGDDTFNIQGTHTWATTVNAGAGEDTINVQTVSGDTTVNAGADDDVVNVGSSAPTAGGVLDGIGARLSINGDGGADTVNLDDSADAADNLGTLTGSTLSGLGMGGTINYAGIDILNLDLGSGDDRINVHGTSAMTNLDTAQGDDLIYVSSGANLGALDSAPANSDLEVLHDAILHGTLDAVTGILNIEAGTGQNTLGVSDRTDADADANVVLTATSIQGLATAAINYLATGGDFSGQGAWARSADRGLFGRGINIYAGAGGNTINVQGTASAGVLTTPFGKTITGIYSGAGADQVSVAATLLDDGGRFAVIYGEAGADSIDASASGLPLTIFGGDDGDTLVGSALADFIFGDAGRDTLLGGGSGDYLLGDEGAVYYRVPEGTSDAFDIILNSLGSNAAAGDGGDGLFLTPDLVTSLTAVDDANDAIFGEDGADRIIGGGNDDSASDLNTETLGGAAGADIVLGDYGQFMLDGGVLTQVTTIDPETGGADNITGGTGNDILLGGFGSDIITAGAGHDIALGDNGLLVYDSDGDLATLDRVQTTAPDYGDSDMVYGGAGNDLIAGGAAGDLLYGGNGVAAAPVVGTDFDIILGDNGEFVAIEDLATQRLQSIETTDTAAATGGDDRIEGNEDDDIIMGGVGADTIDGNAGSDLILGDNGRLDSRAPGEDSNPRYRVLTGDALYGDGLNGGADGEALVDLASQYGRPGGAERWANFELILDAGQNVPHAGDTVAGGAGDDTLFGQGGNDTIQGDGSITTAVSDVRNADGTLVNPSTEQASDGDDYIEGNAGDDLIFGNLGQDDLIGGSSSLFGLSGAADGADIIFGGAGTDTARNTFGDETDTGHATDADMILGDNGNIFRLVGTNGLDGGTFLSFSYDNYSAAEHIIVRAAELLDYTPGGSDYDPLNAGTDLGAGDELHGEAGDDFIYGMVGNDVLFGEGQNDDLIGGYGHDAIFGGTGADGVLGDDGRIYTSRNSTTTGESLYGLAPLAAVDVVISTPGKIQQATINVDGALKKTVNLTPFNVDPNGDVLFDATQGDDIIYGGLGDDFLHGGVGDDAISGAEALAQYYTNTSNTGNILHYGEERAGEFGAYNEFEPRRKILVDENGLFTEDGSGVEFLLNFEAADAGAPVVGTGPDGVTPVYSDGNDVIFGDLGNDWLVGGTGQDHIFGGWGDDLLNADDDHDSTAGSGDDRANNIPDGPVASYEDIVHGGAGRDVLIANTGGDRLIDWVGEFNSYLVPFAPFGPFTISRAPQPQIAEYLYALGASDGADPTVFADTGTGQDRNGEPYAELGVVIQKDFEWQDQTGAPDDPQPGNIPGGPRDVLRSATFNTGTSEAFAADSGAWSLQKGRLEVAPETLGADAVSVFHVDAYLPGYYELQATINAGKPTAGFKSNAYLIFDYQSPTDFKYAGINISNDKLEIGYRDASGWHEVVQNNARLKPDTDYNVLLSVNGTTATLVVNNRDVLGYAFAPRTDADGFTYGLNAGMVGIGANNSKGRIDNVKVQVLPPEITFASTEDFSTVNSQLFNGERLGNWVFDAGRYLGTPTEPGEPAVSLTGLSVAPAAVLELETLVNTSGTAGLVFDYYDAEHFKFVALAAATGEVVIGHHTAHGWAVDVAVDRGLQAGTDHTLELKLVGSSVSVIVDGQMVLGHVYNGLVVDGDNGLMTKAGDSSFDDFSFRTNDPAFLVEANGEALLASSEAEAGPVAELNSAALQPVMGAAVQRWSELLAGADPIMLDGVNVRITDLSGDLLGLTVGDTIYIDSDAAGHGWFVDETPLDDAEFSNGIATPDSPAYERMDLLSVLMHEYAHMLGFDHNSQLSETLDAGSRIVPVNLGMFQDLPQDSNDIRIPLVVKEPVPARSGQADVDTGNAALLWDDWQAEFTERPGHGNKPRDMLVFDELSGRWMNTDPEETAQTRGGAAHVVMGRLIEWHDKIRDMVRH